MNSRFIRAGLWLALIALTLGGAPAVVAESASRDWPQFRGTDRSGVSPETGLLEAWPEAGPKEVWRTSIGEGYSGIAVVGDRLYTMYAGEKPAQAGEDGGETKAMEYAAAFDAAGGKEIWRTAIGEKYDTEFGNGPRATPTVHEDTVYVLDSRGNLAALSTADGKKRWDLSLTETFGSDIPHWGYSTSALVDGGKLMIQAGGGEGKSYAALDPATGEVLWTVGDDRPAYNSTLPIDIGGQRRYVYVAGSKVTAIDSDGKEVWSHEWPPGETHAIPLFVPPDMLFVSGAGQVGGALLKVTAGEEGASIEEVWKTRFMRNHFGASVVHDGHIYGFDNATLKCISSADGEMAWARRGFGKGSLILADGHLLVLSDKGQLILAPASPEGFVEKGSTQALEGRSWTSPTLAAGKLYLRNHTEMVVFDLKG